MHEIQASLFDDRLMHTLALLASAISPRGHRAFIQAVGLYNGLHRTPKGEQGHDNDNQLARFAQPLEHRSLPRAKGVFAGLTAIALPLAIMDPDVAQSDLASCATRQVRAKLF